MKVLSADIILHKNVLINAQLALILNTVGIWGVNTCEVLSNKAGGNCRF